MRITDNKTFKLKGVAVHNNRWSYDKVDYNGTWIPVCIICPEHGEFWQTPNYHMKGNGCPTCTYAAINGDKVLRAKSKRPDLSHIEVPEGSKAVPVGTKGDYALVDEEDYERVMEHNWRMSTGYAINNSAGLMHRFIMNPPDDMEVDHIFHNKLDNRKSQMRICTRQENTYNSTKKRHGSQYKGVGWHKKSNKWRAFVGTNGGCVHLGLYNTEEEAARAYDKAAKEIQGDFAWLNFPDD